MAAGRPRAILLDALGTLVALEPPAPRLAAELRRHGVSVSEADAARAIAAEIAYYRAHLDEGRDPASLAALRATCAEAMRAELDAAARSLSSAELTETLLASLRFTVFDDVRPTLEAARSAGQKLVVVSNWDISLPDVLARLGLAALLDGVLTSAGVGARKPGRAIFARALELAAVAADEAVHVGDSLEEDVVGARGAGIEPILVRRDGGRGPVGVRTIASLAELASP
jgi:putative hydrolase of the HAD superfamily